MLLNIKNGSKKLSNKNQSWSHKIFFFLSCHVDNANFLNLTKTSFLWFLVCSRRYRCRTSTVPHQTPPWSNVSPQPRGCLSLPLFARTHAGGIEGRPPLGWLPNSRFIVKAPDGVLLPSERLRSASHLDGVAHARHSCDIYRHPNFWFSSFADSSLPIYLQTKVFNCPLHVLLSVCCCFYWWE